MGCVITENHFLATGFLGAFLAFGFLAALAKDFLAATFLTFGFLAALAFVDFLGATARSRLVEF